MDTVPCLRVSDRKVPGCCSNKAGKILFYFFFFWEDGFFFLFSPANLPPTSGLCCCGRRAVTFTLPLTSWFSDGQLCRRASGVTELSTEEGSVLSSRWNNLGLFVIMSITGAGSCMETAGRASVGYSGFLTSHVGQVLQLM